MSSQGRRYRIGVGRVIRDDRRRDKYVLLKRLSRVSNTNVYIAEHVPKQPSSSSSRAVLAFQTNFVVLKIISMSHTSECLTLSEQVKRSYKPQDHNSIIGINRWFTSGRRICVSMLYMDEGSLRYIVSERFKNGLPEDCIAIALREALLGLSYIHSRGTVHQCFSAANIFVNGSPTSIRLAFEASMYEHDPHNVTQKFNAQGASTSAQNVMDISSWAAAPEFYGSNDSKRYGQKADIWLVGITALELAYGCLPFANREDLNAVIKKITKNKRLPSFGKLMETAKKVKVKVNKGKRVMQFLKKKLKSLTVARKKEKRTASTVPEEEEEEERLFSEDFEEIVVKCLAKKPRKRPTADQILVSSFFINSKDMKYFRQTLLYAKGKEFSN